MPGHMGATTITTQNLLVHRIDTDLNLIFVRGGVPGFDDAYIKITDAVKKVAWRTRKSFMQGKEKADWFRHGVTDLPVPAGTKDLVVAQNWPKVVEWGGK